MDRDIYGSRASSFLSFLTDRLCRSSPEFFLVHLLLLRMDLGVLGVLDVLGVLGVLGGVVRSGGVVGDGCGASCS